MFTKDTVLALLNEKGFESQTIEHEAAFTVDQAQSLRGQLAGGHTKNLFLKDKKGQYFMVSALEDADINLKTIHTLIGGRGRVSFGQADKMEAYLGVVPGSVTLLAALNDDTKQVRIIMDKALADEALINVHPLINTATTQMKTRDLLALLAEYNHMPEIIDLNADADA